MSLRNIALVPAYEPTTTLLEVLAQLREAGMEIVLVDDGSGFQYAELFDKASSFATVLTCALNKGKGAALKARMSYIQKTFGKDCVIVTVDADGQHRACDAIKLCHIAGQRADTLVLGSRKLEENVPLRSQFGNTVTRFVYRLSTGLKVHDTQTGLRAFSIGLLPELLSIPGERYEYEMNVLLEFARKRIPIQETEIETIYIDNNAASHFDTLRDSYRIYKEILIFSASSFVGFLVDYAILSEGWREIKRIFRSSLKEKQEDEDGGADLPELTEGQTFDNVAADITEHYTQPPKPFTEDTLLSAMENAGKADIPDEAERKGLGTPATRAAIIEKLVSAGFVERKGKNLIPTKASMNLVTILPEPLTSPMLTAEWEQRLTAIAKGEADPGEFLDGICAMVKDTVSTYSHISTEGQKLFAPEKEMIGNCPRCGKPVYEGKSNFACSDRSCSFVLWKNDRFWTSRKKELTKKMAADLLKKGKTAVKGMWSEKKGDTYDATVILEDTGGKYINFKLEFPKRKDGANGRK